MKIAIRMDDITPDMDWECFDRFRALLDKYRVKPLIGVVPDNKDPKLMIDSPKEDFWNLIIHLQQEGWIVAMHGLHHVYTTDKGGLFPLNHQSEFAGLPYATQAQMIKDGKAILESHNVITDFFMAPSHTFDRNTIKALKANGFFRMTDGFAKEPYRWNGVVFYPISFSRAASLKSHLDGAVTFVVHVNTMNDSDFDFYENVFKTAELIPFPEYLYVCAGNTTIFHHAKEYLMACAKYAAVHIRNGRGKVLK